MKHDQVKEKIKKINKNVFLVTNHSIRNFTSRKF